MPAPRPIRPAPNKALAPKPAAEPAAAPPPPAPGTVKPSTRLTAAKPAASARAAAPPPPPPTAAKQPAVKPATASVSKPATASVSKPTAAAKVETAALQRQPAAKPAAPAKPAAAKPPAKPGTARLARGQRGLAEEQTGVVYRGGLGRRQLMWIAIGGGVLLLAIIVLAAAWNPMQRSRQLAALDACRDPSRVEDARALARAFASTWGERSEYVVDAITAGRGSVEARIELCRAGTHLRLLAGMMQDEKLQPAQRGLICAALSEMWPADGTGPAVTDSINSWALGPEAVAELSEPALRLVVARAASDAPELLARGASDARLPADRALKIALGLGRVLDRQGNGVKPLLQAFGGAHRAVLLASAPLQDVVRAQAMNSDLDALYPLLEKPDSLLVGLAGLASKRVSLSDKDAAQRDALVGRLTPLLAAGSEDATLAAALQVVRRQRLIECRKQVLALLPRLAKKRPEQLPAEDLAELLGRSLVGTQSPAATAAAEEMVAGLSAALDRDATRVLAAVALAKVQDANLESLRLALDELASHGREDACLDALDVLVSGPYGRKDLVQAAAKRSWSAILADDRRKRARYEAVKQWMKEHSEETTVRSDKAVITANKAELGKMRDEIRAWQESTDPLPIGLTKAKLDDLANQVQLMLNMMLKASSGV